ncbi:lactoylglutathione lyase [Sporanaerobium hydrogeniformans]|uniref:Lactoylglutathione lyase n=1 Tax=Sporanaerobium hydrogeniformans TaxID=3072179 RepID=A0AC61DDW3_9FIRM|nr:VOC family protein [Sporanaerobium hydrogeniformans]PHV71003.1 lactoylglutathione lyase [Sporanaerobium hydrogeniformans]
MNYRMLHTCLRVMDLEKSIQFYREVLGLKETRRKDFKEHAFTLVYLSDDKASYELELTYNYHPEKPYEIGNGFSHIAVSVDDLEASHAELKALGYEVTDLKGLPGETPRYYFVTDPDGYKVEVIRA